tara:strand:+ start:110 stop:673 length:564 start_codon:yes stop_codon:yes gene_type:complete
MADREIVIGADAATKSQLGALPTDTDDLVEINLERCQVTILGFLYVAGGEDIDDGKGGTFVSQDQIEMHCRINDIEGIDDTRQFFSMPGTKTNAEGEEERSAVSNNSKYGIWLATLAGHGISGNERVATKYHFEDLEDLIGLTYERELQEFPGFRNKTIDVDVPIDIVNIDNEVREQAGLAPAELVS